MSEPSKKAMAIATSNLARYATDYGVRFPVQSDSWMANIRQLAEAIDAHAAEMVAEERRRVKAWGAWLDLRAAWTPGRLRVLFFNRAYQTYRKGIESGDWPEGVDRG
jgi:hypothetical protein